MINAGIVQKRDSCFTLHAPAINSEPEIISKVQPIIFDEVDIKNPVQPELQPQPKSP